MAILPSDDYCLMTIFLPCPKVVIISNTHCISKTQNPNDVEVSYSGSLERENGDVTQSSIKYRPRSDGIFPTRQTLTFCTSLLCIFNLGQRRNGDNVIEPGPFMQSSPALCGRPAPFLYHSQQTEWQTSMLLPWSFTLSERYWHKPLSKSFSSAKRLPPFCPGMGKVLLKRNLVPVTFR